jgi:hypothetical protein
MKSTSYEAIPRNRRGRLIVAALAIPRNRRPLLLGAALHRPATLNLELATEAYS